MKSQGITKVSKFYLQGTMNVFVNYKIYHYRLYYIDKTKVNHTELY